MSLSRAFMNIDGHKIKNGCKVMASSIFPYHRNKFDLKMIYVPNEYGIELNVRIMEYHRH